MPPGARDATPEQLHEALGRAKPLYAISGAGDLAIEKLRGLRRLPAVVRLQTAQSYELLSRRGRQLVSRLRPRKSMQQLVEQMDETIRRARAARGTGATQGRGGQPPARE